MTTQIRQILSKPRPVYIGEDDADRRHNPIAALLPVQAIARIAAENQEILLAIGPFVALIARKIGYSASKTAGLRRTLLSCEPLTAAKAAYDAIEQLGPLFDRTCAELQAPDTPEKLAGYFTAGISERIAYELLLRSGVPQSEIITDAFVCLDDARGRINGRNLDYLWLMSNASVAGLCECKNQPATLLREYSKRGLPRESGYWHGSKCRMVLETAVALDQGGWRVHAACLTLRPREVVNCEGLPVPPPLLIYCLDELNTRFCDEISIARTGSPRGILPLAPSPPPVT